MLLVLQRIEDISAAKITITAQGFTMTDEPPQFIFSMVPSVLEDLQIESVGQAIVVLFKFPSEFAFREKTTKAELEFVLFFQAPTQKLEWKTSVTVTR